MTATSLDDVQNIAPTVQYIAANGQTVFPYPFPITQDSDLVLYINTAQQGTDTGYSLTGVGNDTGGNLVLAVGARAGDIYTLTRDIPIERLTQFSQNGGFSSQAFNDEFNNIYLILQQLEQAGSLALSIPSTNPGNPTTVLTPALYANKALLFDTNGNPIPGVLAATAVTAAIIGGLITPQTAGEASVGVVPTNLQYPPGNVLRYGIVPNSSGAAGANTSALLALVSSSLHVTGWVGDLYFPNTTGADVYWLSDMIDFRDNIYVDLCGSTLQFTKAIVDAHDTGAAFIMAQRNFGIQNGILSVNYTGGINTGSVFKFGARGSEAGGGVYYPNSWDSLLASTQGNIYARNLRISTNNPGGQIGELSGGLDNVILENIDADGGGVADGIDYEFGWATSGTTNLRQTSHAKNLVFRNIRITNVLGNTGTAILLTGAYNFLIENLYVNNAVTAVGAGPGESLYYRPWVSTDDTGCKRTKRILNVVGENLTGHGISVQASGIGTAGYLAAIVANPPLTATQLIAAQTHLGDFIIDGFALSSSSGIDTGVLTSGHMTQIKNGKVSGFSNGIAAYDDATFTLIENCHVIGNTGTGINLAIGNSVALAGVPTFLKKAIIRGCLIAGNSTATPDASPGIAIDNADGVIIEGNRINFEVAFPGEADETTQANAVQLSAGATNVVCRSNRVGAMVSSSVAYWFITTSPPGANNTIENPTGTTTTHGVWDGVEQAWTPTLTCQTPGNLAVSYTTRLGGYTKKGNRVDYWYLIVTSAFTHTAGESGNVEITGLPYLCTNVANKNQMGPVAWGGVTKASYTDISGDVAANTQFVQFYASGSAQAVAHLLIGDLPTGGTVQLQGSGSYFV